MDVNSTKLLLENAQKDINAIFDDLFIALAIASGEPVPISPEDRKRIIKLYEQGETTESISVSFPKYKTQQLAGILAHCNMNTYKKRRKNEFN